jgi:hypothetical protein
MIHRMNAKLTRAAARLDVTVNRRHRASSLPAIVVRLRTSGAARQIQSTRKYFCQWKIIFPCSCSHNVAFSHA